MSISPRTFWLPSGDRYVLFTPDALAHMYAYQQNRPWHREAGGELFAPDPDANGLIIVEAAGPTARDTRKRRFFNQDPEAATLERVMQYEQGFHAIGLWHTHPEKQPFPSGQDKKTTRQYFDDFKGARRQYLLAVMGYGGHIPPLSVWTTEGQGWAELIEALEPSGTETWKRTME